MSSSIEELVNAFNLNNYFSDNVYTNFAVEGRKIVGLFAYDTDVGEYLRRIGEEIIKQQYSDREVADKCYNLNCFPFVLDANPGRQESGIEGVVKVKLADSADKEVIRNLKVHFANEFKRAVISLVVARLRKVMGVGEEEAYEWVKNTTKTGVFDESNLLKKDYLYCIAFDGEYLEREGYDSETFELFKKMYIQEFNSRLEECGLKNSDFYHYKDDMLYIKDVNDKEVVERVAKYVRGRVAFDFRTPGKEDSKVKNFKDVFRSLISKWTGKSIDGYDYDVFTNEKKIENDNSFVLIPLTESDGQFESLKYRDAYKINTIHKGLIRDIRGETEKLYITHCKDRVYGISNKKIAKVLPEIMQYPIARNERTGHFEFAADLGPSSSVRYPRPDPVVSPVSSVQKTGVAVPGIVDDIKNNPDPSMSGQNPGEGYDYMQDSSQSVNTRDLSGKKLNIDERNLSADSVLSSEFDASRPPSGMGRMTDDSGVYSSQELPTSDPEGPIGSLPVRVVGDPQNLFYTSVIECRQDSSEFDTMESDGKLKLDCGSSSWASSLSFSSSTSDTSVGTVIRGEDSSLESSLSQSASSESSEEKSGRFSLFRRKSSGSKSTLTSPAHDLGLPNGDIYDENMQEPSAKLSQMELEFPQSNQGKELKRFPRLESEEGGYSII